MGCHKADDRDSEEDILTRSAHRNDVVRLDWCVGHMKRRQRLNAATSAGLSENHSPFL